MTVVEIVLIALIAYLVGCVMAAQLMYALVHDKGLVDKKSFLDYLILIALSWVTILAVVFTATKDAVSRYRKQRKSRRNQ